MIVTVHCASDANKESDRFLRPNGGAMARTPKMQDVADRAGVSRALVSSYLNTPHLVSAASRDRIQSAIDELRFVRNDAARQLRHRSSQMVAFIAFDISDPLFSSVARGAQAAAKDSGLSLVLADTAGQAETERSYLRLFTEQRVKGILLSPTGDPWDYLRDLEDHGIPAVLIDQASPSKRWSSVTVDDVLGGELAVGHLVDIGCSRIMMVGGPRDIPQVADRVQGAHNVAARSAATVLEYVATDSRDVRAGRAVGSAILERPRQEWPQGIFCINDLLAAGLVHRLLEAGVAVPQDIAVVGYNDTGEDALSPVPLSSIRQPHEEFGEAAITALLEDSSLEPSTPRQHVIFRPELIVRQSTGMPEAQ